MLFARADHLLSNAVPAVSHSNPSTIATADCTYRVASQGSTIFDRLEIEVRYKNLGGSGNNTHAKLYIVL